MVVLVYVPVPACVHVPDLFEVQTVLFHTQFKFIASTISGTGTLAGTGTKPHIHRSYSYRTNSYLNSTSDPVNLITLDR